MAVNYSAVPENMKRPGSYIQVTVPDWYPNLPPVVLKQPLDLWDRQSNDEALRQIAEEHGALLAIFQENDYWPYGPVFEGTTPHNKGLLKGHTIYLGVFTKEEYRVACFFHELGHYLLGHVGEADRKGEHLSREQAAWSVGFEMAARYGLYFGPDGNRFRAECLNTYRHDYFPSVYASAFPV